MRRKWDMYITLYDVYADVVYLVLYSECNKYEAGEMIELHPQPVTMDDRVRMVEESGDLSNLYQLRIVTDLESDGDNGMRMMDITQKKWSSMMVMMYWRY